MRYIKKINDVPFGVLCLIAFTCGIMVMSLFKSTATNAETVMAPNSYVSTDGESAKVVTGNPETADGKPVAYEKTNVIPITPKVTTRNTSTGAFHKEIAVPVKKPCLPMEDPEEGNCISKMEGSR